MQSMMALGLTAMSVLYGKLIFAPTRMLDCDFCSSKQIVVFAVSEGLLAGSGSFYTDEVNDAQVFEQVLLLSYGMRCF